MKVYLLQIKFFGDLVSDTGTTVENIGIYQRKHDARRQLAIIVNSDRYDNYVVDPRLRTRTRLCYCVVWKIRQLGRIL